MGHLYLTGISGSGKTTIGSLLASQLKVPFYDLDETIEQQEGLSIKEIVERQGWIYFRKIETQVLNRIAKKPSGVIALGGSTLIYPSNFSTVRKSGKIVYIKVTPTIIAQRVFRSNKLRFIECETLEETLHTAQTLHYERNAIFSLSDFIVDILDPTETANTTAHRIYSLLKEEIANLFSMVDGAAVPRNSTEHTILFPTEYYLGNGKLMEIVRDLLNRYQPKDVLLFTDENVDALYSSVLLRSIPSSIPCRKIVFPAGESSKSMETVEHTISQVFHHPIERNTILLGFGGGVVTDLSGFVASILLRGLRWIAIPTTIIGMVDAAIGGKTSVNIPQGKNLIGTFYPPLAVVIDPSIATTLPPKEIQCGWGEIIKYGLLCGKELWNQIKQSDFTTIPNAEILFQCVEYKRSIIEFDLLEKGERKYLNLGHTSGHALETALGYQTLSHGEAVLWGIGVAVKLSKLLRNFPETEFQEIRSIFMQFSLPVVNCSLSELLGALQHDKKSSQGLLRWVLLDAIGQPIFDCPIAMEVVIPVLEEHLNFLRFGKVMQ